LGLGLVPAIAGAQPAAVKAPAPRIPLARTLVRSDCDGGPIDVNELEKELTTTGLHGWLHGAAGDFDQFVFTWRDPKDFFTYMEFSLVVKDAQLMQQLHSMKRHDEVVIHGVFKDNPSPQKHIELHDLTVVKPYESGVSAPPYHRVAKLPDDLLGKSELDGVVHAVAAQGGILVIEYKDAVVPVFVENNQYTQNLYRGDKIHLHYTLLPFPKHPTHLTLDTSAAKPLVVTDSLVAQHGKKMTLEGILGFFPKSPEINMDVYSLQVTDAQNLKRNYTLVNLDDDQIFLAVQGKAAKLWQAGKATLEDGRNMYINRQIKLRVTGTVNEICPNQANPQISLSSVDDLVVLP
jgi:hypothetical protein